MIKGTSFLLLLTLFAFSFAFDRDDDTEFHKLEVENGVFHSIRVDTLEMETIDDYSEITRCSPRVSS